MGYLFNKWNKLKEEVKNKFLFIFLDYDGTLTPIAKKPEEALFPQKTKDLLQQLANMPGCELAIISGRSLKEVKKLVGLNKIIYVGNHGLEIEGPKIKFTFRGLDKYVEIIKKIKHDLRERLARIKGVFIEDKGLTLSLHYRLADEKNIPLIKTIFHETIFLYRSKERIKIGQGKMLLEIKPPLNWDKGRIVLWLLARKSFALDKRQILPIYIGDDETDEDAFKALKNKGVTIFVGELKESAAQYYLKDTEEVVRFLKEILDTFAANKPRSLEQGKEWPLSINPEQTPGFRPGCVEWVDLKKRGSYGRNNKG